MAEKIASIRLEEEDLKQFRQFAKDNNMNHQQAFNSLLALVELDRAKNKLGDRAKEIEAFRETINKLLNFYIASLDINHTTEETIREEFKKDLNTKNDTIANLQDQINKLKEDKQNYKETSKNTENNNKELQQKLQKLEEELIEKQKIIEILNGSNVQQQEQQQELAQSFKEYKKQYNDLEKTYKEQTNKLQGQASTLQAQLTNSQQQQRDKDNKIAQLEGKLELSNDKIQFYKDNNATLQNRMNLLDKEYKDQLKQSNKDIEERCKVIYASKLLKKDEEIHNLTKKIEELEAKSKKRMLTQEQQ